MKYGLDNRVLENIVLVLKRFPQIDEAILYGSRAKGTHKRGSDIDITLVGNALDLETLNKITGELDSLPFPYTFDVSIFQRITNKDLIGHIERVGKSLYRK